MGQTRAYTRYAVSQLPNAPDTLQESIITTIHDLRDELPVHLQASFGISGNEAAILWHLARYETNEKPGILAEKLNIPPQSLKVLLFRLREKLEAHGITVGERYQPVGLGAAGKKKVHETLAPAARMHDTAKQILASKSLNITYHDLPSEPKELQRIQRSINDLFCADVETNEITRMGFSLQQAVTLCVYAAALREGRNYVLRHHIRAALHPVFSETDGDPVMAERDSLRQLRRKLGCVSPAMMHDYITIEPQIRDFLSPFVDRLRAERQPA